MTETQLRQLVQEIVLEMMAKTPERPKAPSRRALVLFTGAWLGFDQSIVQLQQLRDDGVQLDVIQTESARRFLEQDKIATLGPEVTDNLVSDHPMLIVPTFTVNCAAKVAYGMADNLATNVIHEFILLNRPVVAVRTAACPDDLEKKDWFPDIPAAFAEVLRSNLKTLTSFGVTLCGSTELRRAVLERWQDMDEVVKPAFDVDDEEPRLDFVCHTTIRDLQPGSVVRVTERAIVTQLARDEAAASGIRISREGD